MNLFDALRRGLQNSGLQVETPNERIRMLSGTEEGLFGWVSVNSILKLINAVSNFRTMISFMVNKLSVDVWASVILKNRLFCLVFSRGEGLEYEDSKTPSD